MDTAVIFTLIEVIIVVVAVMDNPTANGTATKMICLIAI
jgi:hypothetical protein